MRGMWRNEPGDFTGWMGIPAEVRIWTGCGLWSQNQITVKKNGKSFSGICSIKAVKSSNKTNTKRFEEDFLGLPDNPSDQSGDQGKNMFVHHYFYDKQSHWMGKERNFAMCCNPEDKTLANHYNGIPRLLADLFHFVVPITLSGTGSVSNLQISPSSFALPHPNSTGNRCQGFFLRDLLWVQCIRRHPLSIYLVWHKNFQEDRALLV